MDAQQQQQTTDTPNMLPETNTDTQNILPEKLGEIKTQTDGNIVKSQHEDPDSLIEFVTSKLQDIDFLDVLRHASPKDTLLRKILHSPQEYHNFEVINGLVYLKNHRRQILCIPDSVIVDRQSIKEIIISEAHSLLAHLGSQKTQTYLKDHVW